MKTNLLQRKRLLTEESNRCYLCDDPVCTKACKPGLDPGRLLRACKMDNLAGAILRAYRMGSLGKDCDGILARRPASADEPTGRYPSPRSYGNYKICQTRRIVLPSLRLRTWRSTFVVSAAPTPLYWPPRP